ncbi:carbon-phosphorus lyase complex subunit PhnI [Vibrio genomosp. F10 str. 9ZC157]|uniref:Carbon-phosphorus lyase complex subunit PhnI n=1 Tax=Vibrio genomosp. F10 str. ZF-129 TaxID=1187848 RepID=A0A1E5BK33_9VIBR|nr:carbon-phosphorus lyase complex subunit PhnI [Vibrio genomosp. F10]OEE38133.1 carbon-phosphorus lyase complex subunit PhnI [Vibrio genomosp. F10 str. ZF-129]OEE97074.1 carbon-phosphorus lyase complex subunit PhnI [Vibrio genomosp. F10 str. 9ZC157]
MYVAVKGGEKAIEAAHRLQEKKRRGPKSQHALSVDQIAHQLAGATDRVMTEGSIYDKELAALAIKQAGGDLIEAIFLLRAYRTTLPRLAVTQPVNTEEMKIERRISASYKDLPGGQLLGPTYDYTHRLLDFALLAEGNDSLHHDHYPGREELKSSELDSCCNEACPQVLKILENLDLAVPENDSGELPDDITVTPPTFPANRSARLQQLARSDEGFLLALGYSTQRGYGRNHPFAGEIRSGKVTLELIPEELGFSIEIGDIELTECQMINGFTGNKNEKARFTRGYGVTFGFSERKAMSMALVDRSLQCQQYGEVPQGPAQDEEFVLSHGDNVEASGFVSHLKLPHYVDFQSELALIRKLQKEFDARIKTEKEQGNDD